MTRFSGEIEDINEEHRNRMRDLEQTLDALIRENKFYQMILDNFVPVEESRKLENRAEFDDERETWRFRPIAEAAGLKAMMKRPERYLIRAQRTVLGNSKLYPFKGSPDQSHLFLKSMSERGGSVSF